MSGQIKVGTALNERFARIRAFYRKHEAEIVASPDDWFDDAYSWDHECGIRLTPIESALWRDIRAESMVVYPQYPVGRFFVDFGNPVWRVAIECDGARWHLDGERDAARQMEIERLGWKVFRISGRDCLTDFEEVEDDDGMPVVQPSAARLFIRGVLDEFPCLRRVS